MMLLSYFVYVVATIPIYSFAPDIEHHNAELFGCMRATSIITGNIKTRAKSL